MAATIKDLQKREGMRQGGRLKDVRAEMGEHRKMLSENPDAFLQQIEMSEALAARRQAEWIKHQTMADEAQRKWNEERQEFRKMIREAERERDKEREKNKKRGHVATATIASSPIAHMLSPGLNKHATGDQLDAGNNKANSMLNSALEMRLERLEQEKGRAPGKGNSGRGRGRGVVEGVFAAVDREIRGMHVGGESTLSEAREAGPAGVGGMGWKGVRTSHLHRCCVVLVVQEVQLADHSKLLVLLRRVDLPLFHW